MNSKERVIRAIRHEEPDRVPVGEWGIDHDHVSRIIGHPTYWRNRKETTLALWDGRRDEVVDGMKRDLAELVDKLDYDILVADLVPPKGYSLEDPPKQTGEGRWEDSAGNVYQYAASNDSIQCMTHREGLEELAQEDIDFRSADRLDDSVFELIDFIGDKYGDEKAVLCRGLDVYNVLLEPFGGDFNHQLILSAIAPDEIKKMYRAGLEYNRRIIEHCAKHKVLIGMQGNDFGMNSGCLLSPDSIRDIYLPFIRLVNEEQEKNGLIPFFHSCGKIWDILGDFVEAGYKGYQSIQASAGMDNLAVKEKYGRDLTLWAGIQCETLVKGTLQEVEQEVRENLRCLMPGGGFIFGSTNSVQFGANTDNYLRALEIVREEGVYR